MHLVVYALKRAGSSGGVSVRLLTTEEQSAAHLAPCRVAQQQSSLPGTLAPMFTALSNSFGHESCVYCQWRYGQQQQWQRYDD